ncbi:glycosyltransferase family 69 protein [Metarhizium album ARSEF 1941]|uniref:Glycosyltransferase family 69 protein n=1 Tax=Metarhizium album (strain ARSEF 1941) TaxID=1081103 RepID=A0A0B2X250_METAS|nr:glycosyltransferase family 69 protein [Metarhizium album ARSEF 1941]KHN99782.1 glycosyltransferase family 69 protein [Metarhizium album ARSEF 1941]
MVRSRPSMPTWCRFVPQDDAIAKGKVKQSVTLAGGVESINVIPDEPRGAVAFAAQPVLHDAVRSRAADETTGEGIQGEPQLFRKDLWFRGHRRLAVLPSVNL